MTNSKRLLGATAALMMSAMTATADVNQQLSVAIGTPGSDSFTFGTELWAMSQIALMPTHDITLASKEVAADQDRLALLQEREVEAALVYGRVPNAYDEDVRAIMALWPRGIASDDADPVQFLIHKDVGADVVYLLTKAMFEHAGYFKNAHPHLGVGRPSVAMTGLDIPLHAGAYRYYQENGDLDDGMNAGFWRNADRADGEEAVQEAASKGAASTYHNFDDASLAPDEIEQIAAACRQALDVGSLTVVLGDLDTTGCEVYQDRLTDEKTAAAPDRQPSAPAVELPVRTLASEVSEDDFLASPAVAGKGGPAISLKPAAAAGLKDRSNQRRSLEPVM